MGKLFKSLIAAIVITTLFFLWFFWAIYSLYNPYSGAVFLFIHIIGILTISIYKYQDPKKKTDD